MSSLRISFSRLSIALTLLLLLCHANGYAQVLFGSFTGNVTDASSAGVAGATVKVTETSTGESRSVQTNEAGVYNVTTLSGGVYQIEITRTGFRAFVSSNVVLNQNNVVRVDASLQLGAQTDTIEVTSDVAARQTDRADVHWTSARSVCSAATSEVTSIVSVCAPN